MHRLCPQATPMSPSPQAMLPKRLGTLVSTHIHTLDSGILAKHNKVLHILVQRLLCYLVILA